MKFDGDEEYKDPDEIGGSVPTDLDIDAEDEFLDDEFLDDDVADEEVAAKEENEEIAEFLDMN